MVTEPSVGSLMLVSEGKLYFVLILSLWLCNITWLCHMSVLSVACGTYILVHVVCTWHVHGRCFSHGNPPGTFQPPNMRENQSSASKLKLYKLYNWKQTFYRRVECSDRNDERSASTSNVHLEQVERLVLGQNPIFEPKSHETTYKPILRSQYDP